MHSHGRNGVETVGPQKGLCPKSLHLVEAPGGGKAGFRRQKVGDLSLVPSLLFEMPGLINTSPKASLVSFSRQLSCFDKTRKATSRNARGTHSSVPAGGLVGQKSGFRPPTGRSAGTPTRAQLRAHSGDRFPVKHLPCSSHFPKCKILQGPVGFGNPDNF